MSSARFLRSALCRLPFLRRLAKDRSGSVAMIFGVTALLLFLVVGIVVDMGRTFLAKNRLEHALDAAGLAVGASSTGYTSEQGICTSSTSYYLPIIADQYFNANYNASVGTPTSVSAPVNVCQSSDGNTLILSSSVTVPTTFLSIFGYHALGATTSSTITRATSGLEVALVLDNTFSMTEDTTDNVEALLALKQATYEFINELWTQNATSDALSPAPAAIPGLYVGVVPFVAQVNVLNTTSDATVGTKKYELLGSDANTKVSDIVNITSTGLTQPLCGYNGNWTPSSDDQVAPLDLIHLAQDLCVKYITTVNSSTGVEGFSGAPAWGSYYLVDDLNSSALSGYAWAGCVEGRITEGDTSSTPYWDQNTASPIDAAFDFDLTVGNAGTLKAGGNGKTADFLWHIYRPGNSGSYTAGPAEPNTATLKSKYYAAAPTTPTIVQNTSTNTYYQTILYNFPRPIVAVKQCSSGSSSTNCKNPQAVTYQFGGKIGSGTGAPTVGSSTPDYYWAAPSSSSNGTTQGCQQQSIMPLSNNYSTFASEIGPSASTTQGLVAQSQTGTLADSAWAWGARLLAGAAPFNEATPIEASTSQGAAGWKKVIIFMTDGNMNFTTSYTNFAKAGTPLHTAITDNGNSAPMTATTPVPGWSSAPATGCGYTPNKTGVGSDTLDSYQIMCRIYQVCTSLRSQNYYIYTILFSHDSTDPTSTDEQLMMQKCTADGSGGVDTTKYFPVVSSSDLSAAFTSIGAQLAQLRIAR